MTSQNWIDLNEFSVKYKISLSTLRRRIRFGEIENIFRDGKYWVPDLPVPKHLKSKEPARKISAPQPAVSQATVQPAQVKVQPATPVPNSSEQVNSELKNLVTELKSAYVTVLHDKEDQITQLKEEVADLKTLVKILESENERLKNLAGNNDSELPIIKNWQLGDLDL